MNYGNEELKEYERLEQEILQDCDHFLIEKKRMRFYFLHEKLEISNKLELHIQINGLIDQKRKNPKFFLGENEYHEEQLIFGFLEKKRISKGLDRFEYNFLSYLIFKNNFASIICKPELPEIREIKLSNFMERFVFNKGRSDIFENLISALNLALKLYEIVTINILIGGGFIDLNNMRPKDIDIVLLLPSKIFMKDINDRVKKKIFELHKKIDLSKLPHNYNLKIYSTYELLTLISNKPVYKELIINNSYINHQVFQLNYP